jgi:hypothetical protein
LSDITELKAAHAAQLAAPQQHIQQLTGKLATQQLTNLQQQQQQQQQQQDLVSVESSTPGSGGTAQVPFKQPKSAAAAAVAAVRPQTAVMRPHSAAPSAAPPAGSKPSWAITGSAALVRHDYKKDLTYAGALLDSNAQKDISLATGNNNSSSSSGGMGSRPGTAPARGPHTGSSGSNGGGCGSNGGSSDDSALLLKLREQVEREFVSELQTRAAQLLQTYSSTAAAAAAAEPAAAAAVAAEPAAAEGKAASQPEAQAGISAEASAAATAANAAVTQPPQNEDALLLAEYAVQLQEQLNRWVKTA